MIDSKRKTKNLDGIIPAHWMSGSSGNSKTESNLSPRERVKMIEKIYLEVLNREPDTRDLNYYKYSSATEEMIMQELLESDEHKKLLEYGREYQKTKNLLENANSKIKALESGIRDQEDSLKEMQKLLKEKNLHIEELNKKIKSPFEEID